MDVRQEPFRDRGEPDGTGGYDYWYEGVWFTFTFDGSRTLRARRYQDTAGEASIFFNPDGPHEGDPETVLAVAWLHDAGVETVKVLSGDDGGYRPIRH